MAKGSSIQNCKRCDYAFAKDKMKCPHCNFYVHALTTFVDDTILLSDIQKSEHNVIPTGFWDKVFSSRGGLVRKGVSLIAGAPGAGKSTFLLQLADAIVQHTGREFFMVGAEEDQEEIRIRGDRLKLRNMNKIRLYPMGASSDMSAAIRACKPSGFLIDSINALCGEDLAAASEMAKAAKDHAVTLDCPGILISHVTKSFDIAGSMALQHHVDTTMVLTPLYDQIRSLETKKNRFGPTCRVIMEMTALGLVQSDDLDDEQVEEYMRKNMEDGEGDEEESD